MRLPRSILRVSRKENIPRAENLPAGPEKTKPGINVPGSNLHPPSDSIQLKNKSWTPPSKTDLQRRTTNHPARLLTPPTADQQRMSCKPPHPPCDSLRLQNNRPAKKIIDCRTPLPPPRSLQHQSASRERLHHHPASQPRPEISRCALKGPQRAAQTSSKNLKLFILLGFPGDYILVLHSL